MTLRKGLILAALGAGLAGCQSSGTTSFASLTSPIHGMPLTIESIDGPPAPLQTAIVDELASAAARNNVELVTDGSPVRYRVRGYLTADTHAAGKPALAYVWDVFDAQKRRATRVSGSSSLKASPRNPWDSLDKETLAKLAADSMAEIASFLAEARTDVALAETDDVAPASAMSYASP
jgi:sugar phosphate isomerase/epimerase